LEAAISGFNLGEKLKSISKTSKRKYQKLNEKSTQSVVIVDGKDSTHL